MTKKAKVSNTFILISRLFISLSAILFILICVAVFRTLNISKHEETELCVVADKDYISPARGLVNHLTDALKFETISHSLHNYNTVALNEFIMYIKKTFPHLHSSSLVKLEVVNNHSLLYFIEGSNKVLKPYMLAGHLDVVPVETQYWEEPPFSGKVKDGYVWGRGSIDCKHIIMGILESLEFLLEKGYTFQRSLYVAFGHDEEVSGLDGAQQIATLLKSRRVELEFILDEGSFVLDKFFPGIEFPLAIISVSEKGRLDLKLEVHDTPGHSSYPKREPVIVILSKALAKLEGDVFPSLFGTGPEIKMFQEVARCEVPFPLKVVLGNTWLFKPIFPMFLKNPVQSALHKTTAAVTMVQGGYKMNVLPSVATAHINFRVHPGQTTQEVLGFVKNLINDERVKISVVTNDTAHPISAIDTFGYENIRKSILQLYPESCVVPGLLIANTDTRWYLGLSSAVYRFSLVRLAFNETSRFHGHNEKIQVDNYVKIVNFYVHLIKNSDRHYEVPIHDHQEL